MTRPSKMIAVQCPKCGAALKRARSSVGKQSKCKDCSGKFVVAVESQSEDPFDCSATLSRLTGDFSKHLNKSDDPLDSMQTTGVSPSTDSPVVAPETPQDTALKLGSMIGERYIITGRLGSGAMGSVYRVIDTQTEQEYAVKVLSNEIRRDTGAVKQLHRELAISQELVHPQLLRIHHFDSTPDHLFIVMEYIDGTNLEELRLTKGGKLSENEVKMFLVRIAAPLDHLHEKGFVHLDLKPHNLILVGGKLSAPLKIADFGISRSLREQIGRNSANFDLQGTLCYMSPEHLRDKVCDGRADLYALGMILYHLLTGKFPFPLTNPVDIINWHTGPEAAISKSGPLWDVIKRFLRRSPDERFSSVKEALDTLVNNMATKGNHSVLDRQKESSNEESKSSAEDLINEGFKLLKADDLESAFEKFELALDIDRKYAPAFYGRCKYFEKKGDVELAIREVSIAIDFADDEHFVLGNFNFPAAYFITRAKLLTSVDRHSESLDDWNQAIKALIADCTRNPDYYQSKLLRMYLRRGNTYYAINEWDKALVDYKTILQSDQNHWSAWFNSGLVHANKLMFETAIKEFTRASELSPKDVSPLKQRGMCYLNLGNYEKGAEDLNRVESDKNNRVDYYRTIHREFKLPTKYSIFSDWHIAFSYDGRRLAIGEAYAGIYVWDLAKNKYLGSTNRRFGESLSFVPGTAHFYADDCVASGHEDKLYLFDSDTLQEISSIKLGGYAAQRVLNGGKSAILKNRNDSSRFHIMDMNAVKFTGSVESGEEVKVVDSTNRLLVTQREADSKLYQFWDLTTGKEINRISLNRFNCLSPNGRQLVGETMDGNHELIDIQTGNKVISLPFLGYTAKFSADGKFIATPFFKTGLPKGAMDVSLWNIETQTVETIFLSHGDTIKWIEFSPDGKLMMTLSENSTIRVWETGL